MQVHRQARSLVAKTLGEDRAVRMSAAEMSWRRRAARVLDPDHGKQTHRPATKRPRSSSSADWQPPDPFADFPAPTMTRHDLLGYLHGELAPRTYLEIGVADGSSMTLSRTRSIGVDPAFGVKKPLQCDVQLVRAKSDAFFALDDPLAHFAGTPVDLAFIDGMHLAEFALRDFMHTERQMSRTGVIVLDDMLPRNALEAARDRKTGPWAGDVYKVVVLLTEQRPDLVVIPVNTSPTGTVIVAGLDPGSSVLEERYEDNLRFCRQPDPQSPPDWIVRRTAALPGEDVVSEAWAALAALREDPSAAAVREAVARLPHVSVGGAAPGGRATMDG